MAETYTNGAWFVTAGEEDSLVAAWRDFASWAHMAGLRDAPTRP